MPMDAIGVDWVDGCEVGTAGEPPIVAAFEIAVVEMDDGAMGASGVKDEGDAGSPEGLVCPVGLFGDRFRRLLGPGVCNRLV